MSRRTVVIAAVALGAVLALSLAAAGLPTSTVTPGEGGVGEGTGNGVGEGSGDGAGDADGGFERPEWIGPLVAITFAILRVLGLLAVTLLVAVLVYLAVTRRETVLAVLRGLLARVPSAVAQVAAVALLALAMLWLWRSGGFPRSAPIVPFVGEGGGESTGPTTTTVTPDQALALLAVLGLAALAVVAVWRLGSRSRSEAQAESGAAAADPADTAQEEPSTADGDRSRSAPSHPVVDAWREMALAAEVGDPRRATPREVADGAAAAGFDREDVAVLTRLFEDVRYGGGDVNEEETDRARRAIDRMRDANGGEQP